MALKYTNIVLTLLISFSALAKDPETLIVSFQKQKNPEELRSATQAVAQHLKAHLGKNVEVIVPSSYGSTSQGLISKKIHVAYMDSLPFLLALEEVDLEILAVEKRNNRTEYDSLIVVGQKSPIQSLKDLKGKRMAFSGQTSTSGFLFPFARLLQDQVIANPKELSHFFSEIIYAGGYDKALLAVANGQADVAAFSDYAFEGDKADLYGSAETRSKIRILARTPGVPTHLIAASKALSPGLRKQIQEALFLLAKEKPEILSSVYGTASLVPAPQGIIHVEKTRAALKSTGLEPKGFVK